MHYLGYQVKRREFSSRRKSFSFRKFLRLQVLFENTLFQSFAFHPEEYHLVTGGSNRKITYWETSTGAQIRSLDASISGPINGLDIDNTGDYLVTGSTDKLVKVNLNPFFSAFENKRLGYLVMAVLRR